MFPILLQGDTFHTLEVSNMFYALQFQTQSVEENM